MTAEAKCQIQRKLTRLLTVTVEKGMKEALEVRKKPRKESFPTAFRKCSASEVFLHFGPVKTTSTSALHEWAIVNWV